MAKTSAQLVLKGNFKQIMRNRDKVLKRIDRASAKALDKFGSQTRKDARRAIGNPAKQKAWKSLGWVTLADGRKVERVSKTGWINSPARAPGKPPKSRTTHEFYSLRNIRFIADYDERRVVVGPWYTGTNKGKYGGQTVPELLEKGGTQKTFARDLVGPADLRKRKGQWVQVGNQTRVVEANAKQPGARPVTWRVRKRPYMQPAFKRQKKKAVEYFKRILK